MERVLQSRRNKHHHSRHLSARHAAADTCSYSKLGPVIRTVGPYVHPISKSPLRHEQLVPFNKRRCASSSLLSYGTTDDGPGKPYRACRYVSPVFCDSPCELCNVAEPDVQEERSLHWNGQRGPRSLVHPNFRPRLHAIRTFQHRRLRLTRYLEHPRRLQTLQA